MKDQFRLAFLSLIISFLLVTQLGCSLSADMAFLGVLPSKEDPIQEQPTSFGSIPDGVIKYARNYKDGVPRSLLVSPSGDVYAYDHSRSFSGEGSGNLVKFDQNLSRTNFSSITPIFRSTESLAVSYNEYVDVYDDGYAVELPYQLTQDSAGRIYLPGSGFEPSTGDDQGGGPANKVDGTEGAIIYRVLPNGALDSSFSEDGVFLSSVFGIFHQVLPLSNGKLFAVGTEFTSDGQIKPFATYLNQDGTIDESFDEDGLLSLWSFSPDEGDFIRAIEQDVAGQKRILLLTRKISGSDRARVYRYKLTGEPDLSFGAGMGYIEAPLETSSRAIDFYLGIDGKISIFTEVFDGSFEINYVQLSKHLSDGTLDTSFDSDGFVRYALDDDTVLVSAGIDSDGNFYYLTSHYDQDVMRVNSFQVCKLNSSGAKDVAFGSAGCLSLGSASEELFAKDLSIGDNGYVYIQALRYESGPWSVAEKTLLLRIDKNTGLLDTAIGTAGLSYYQSDKESTEFWSSIVLPTNAIINVVGDSVLDGGYLEKRNSDYQIDSIFAANISSFRSLYSHITAYGVFHGDERLHVFGHDSVSGNPVLMIFSYDGVFDSTFGVNGFVQLPREYSWGWWNPPVVDSLGRIVVLGSFVESGTPDIPHILVKRFLANGLIDSSFDGDGVLDIASLVAEEGRAGVAIDSSNRLYVYVTTGSGSNVATSLIRIGSDGVRDLSFAGSGVYQVSGPSGAEIQSLLPGPSGEIYLAIKDVDDLKLRVRKLSGAGFVDTSYGVSGDWVSSDAYLEFNLGGGLVFDNRPGHTDKILVFSAAVGAPDSVRRVQAHRITSGGNIDTSFGTAGGISIDVSEFGGISVDNEGSQQFFSLANDGSIFVAFNGYSPADGPVDGLFIKLR